MLHDTLYKLWLFFYKKYNKYGMALEKIIFFKNPTWWYTTTSIFQLNPLQKLILFLFFTPLNSKKLTIFLENTNNVYPLRIFKYNKISKFFAREIYESFKKNKNIKIKNSIIQNHTYTNLDTIDSLMLFNNIANFSDFKRNFYYWKDFEQSVNLNNYLNEEYTYEICKHKTFLGAMQYLSTNDEIHHKHFHKNNTQMYDAKYKLFKSKTYPLGKITKMKNYLSLIDKYNYYYKEFYEYKFKNKSFSAFFKIARIVKLCKNISLNKNFLNFYKKSYLIKYKPTDNTVNIESSKSTILFLRKNKIFNKGRYSRNRQLYRTGVYWCLWLNIINVFGLYYYFYRFVFNFGYFYVPLLILILSIFGARLIKYRFYNPINILNEFNMFITLCLKFTIEIFFNFLIKSKELLIKTAKYVYFYIISFFKE